MLRKMYSDQVITMTSQGKYFLTLESVNTINTINSVNSVNTVNMFTGVYGDDESVNTDKASDTNELKESVYGVYDVYDTTSSTTSNDLETKVNDSLTKLLLLVLGLDKLRPFKKKEMTEENSQPEKLKPWESEQNPLNPPFQNRQPIGRYGSKAPPAVKEKFDEVFNRLQVFLTEENARQKAFERAWDFQQKLRGEAA